LIFSIQRSLPCWASLDSFSVLSSCASAVRLVWVFAPRFPQLFFVFPFHPIFVHFFGSCFLFASKARDYFSCLFSSVCSWIPVPISTLFCGGPFVLLRVRAQYSSVGVRFSIEQKPPVLFHPQSRSGIFTCHRFVATAPDFVSPAKLRSGSFCPTPVGAQVAAFVARLPFLAVLLSVLVLLSPGFLGLWSLSSAASIQ
jgi:hypothetical protein